VRVLVTGGAGFIGSNYVRSVLAGRYASMADAQVTVLDKLTYSGSLENLAAFRDDRRLTFVQGDIGDAGLVSDLMPGHDAVVHFAAESHVDRSIQGAAGVERFAHVSTDEVYGSIAEGSWTEDWPLSPNSPYSASKAGSDLLALAAYRTHRMDVVVTRCSNNYGPYQFPEKVIPLFVTNLLDGRKVPLYGDGGNIRDWLHVDDHCLGIQLALDKGRAGEIYHIGGGTELSNRELTERLLAACGADWSSVEYVTDRKGHDRRYSLSIAKISEELGYQPQVTLDAGLGSTVDWYRENRAWWEPLRARVARHQGA
jgi:dTDP-glucose 4,6-dehydratase